MDLEVFAQNLRTLPSNLLLMPIITSHYDFIFLTFSAVVCPKLTLPDNGGVVPSSCSQTDVEYGTRCVFYCGDGYALSGPRYTTCQNDTSWSEIAPLSCVRGKKYFRASLANHGPFTLCFALTIFGPDNGAY